MSTVKRLKKNPEWYKMCKGQINNMLQRKVAIRLTKEEKAELDQCG